MNAPTAPREFQSAVPAAASRADGSTSHVLTVEDGFDFLGEEYGTLFHASDADAFRHPIWLDAFYRHLAPARGARAVVVTGREAASGRLVFLLPLILRRKTGLALLETADLGVSDYASPVIDGACRASLAADPALPDRVRRALPRHDVLRIRPIRAERVDDWRLFLSARVETLDFCAHEARPAAPYAPWRSAALSPSFRKYLDRRKNRFLKAGEARLTCLEAAETADALADIARLRAGRFAGDPIQNAPTAAFYAEVAARGTPAGLARVYRMSLDGAAVATVFALTHAGRLYYLLIGCDYEAYGRHSPGLVLYDWMMQDWAEAGGAVFDFTIGDEAFKADFATSAVPMSALVATPTWRGRVGLAAYRARAAAAVVKSGLFQRAGALRERGSGG